MNFLGNAYPWVKAAHLIFVIFWMAGLFMLPRYLVYHQEALARDPPDLPAGAARSVPSTRRGAVSSMSSDASPGEAARWIDRETKLRTIILTPSLVVVWGLGLLLAANAGLFAGVGGLGWLHAKLMLVVILTGYHGWAVGYAGALARGTAKLSAGRLRLVNELPAVLVTLIVILVIVRPF